MLTFSYPRGYRIGLVSARGTYTSLWLGDGPGWNHVPFPAHQTDTTHIKSRDLSFLTALWLSSHAVFPESQASSLCGGCGCMCTWMSMSACAHVHTKARSQLQVSFFRTLFSLCFETGSLTGLEGSDSARLAG